MITLRGAVLVSLLLFASSTHAIRTEFLATFAGKRLPGSRVCFFPATADDGFFQKFLSSADVRCLDADSIIDMPAGNWNVFLTHADGYTSTHPTFKKGDDETAKDRAAYGASLVRMQPAAALRFTGTRDSRPVVYFPNSDPDQPATIRPLLPGANDVLIPAAPVVPLLVQGTRIIGVGDVVTAAPGVAVTATFSAPPAGHRDVIALLRLPFDEYDDALDELDVYLDVEGRRYNPLIPPRLGHAIDRSLLLFRHVPKKPGTIVVDGPRWKGQRVALPATSELVHMLEAPIQLERMAEVTVEWQYPAVLPGTPCRLKAHPEKERTATVLVETCENQTTCRTVEERPLDLTANRGNAEFTGLGPGEYRLTVRDSRFGSTSERIAVRRGETEVVPLELDPITISGTVKLGSDAMPADVSFLTGSTTTDMNGTYVALLPREPALETVTVLPCDGSQEYVAIPAEALTDGSIFDIQVPNTALEARVTEAMTGTALGGAAVSAAVLFGKDDVERYYLEASDTDAAGATTLRRVPANAWMRLCASRKGFKPRCSDAFSLELDEEKTISLELTPDHARTGRLVTDVPIINGRLFGVRPDGTIAESRGVGEDGTFSFELPHTEPEHLVFTSTNLPLAVLAVTADPQIGLPREPVRDLVIIPHGVPNARIALGRLVPQRALAHHQTARNQPSVIHDAAQMRVAQIVARQLVLLAGPPTAYLPPGTPPGTDSSTIPHFHALFRRIPAIEPTVDLHP